MPGGRKDGRKEGLEEGREEGRDEGLADAILTLLSARGLVDDDARERLRSTRDPERLRAWLLAAAQADTLAGLFA